MNRLSGKTAIVTGASLGIGRAVSIRMAEEGAKVALLDLLDAEGAALERELTGRGFAAKYFRCDVAREAEVEKAFGDAVKHFGRLDILVNNAGISGATKPTHELKIGRAHV